jgi:hypothetical protein
MSVQAASALRETMARTSVPRVQTFDRKAERLMEQHQPLYVDVSGHSYIAVRALHRNLEERGYQPHIYVKEAALPRQLSEAWINQQATYGLLREGLARDLRIIIDAKHLLALVEAEVKKPKEPNEVDRLKLQQKQQDLQLKTTQNNDLLQAQERELQAKAREKSQKILEPKTPKEPK